MYSFKQFHRIATDVSVHSWLYPRSSLFRHPCLPHFFYSRFSNSICKSGFFFYWIWISTAFTTTKNNDGSNQFITDLGGLICSVYYQVSKWRRSSLFGYPVPPHLILFFYDAHHESSVMEIIELPSVRLVWPVWSKRNQLFEFRPYLPIEVRWEQPASPVDRNDNIITMN